MPATNDVATCLVAIPEGQTLAESLARRLSERHGPIQIRHDAILAMSEACLREKLWQTAAAWETEPAPPTVLVVVDPRPGTEASDLLSAATRYLPRTMIYTVIDGDLDLVAGPETTPESNWSQSPAPPPAAASNGAASSADQDEPSVQVTYEELAMLLQDGAGSG